MSSAILREGNGIWYAVPVTAKHLTIARADTLDALREAVEAKGYDPVEPGEPEPMERAPGTVCILLAAPNDTNGNPRRLFVVFNDTDNMVEVWDEGYHGKPKALGAYNPARIHIPASEYREILRFAKEQGIFRQS